MVSGELVRRRSRTRSLEEDGGQLHQKQADTQLAALDVAKVVDKRLVRHLSTILEAV